LIQLEPPVLETSKEALEDGLAYNGRPEARTNLPVASVFPHRKSDDAKDERLEHPRELGRGILVAGKHADDEILEAVFWRALATPRMNRPSFHNFLVPIDTLGAVLRKTLQEERKDRATDDFYWSRLDRAWSRLHQRSEKELAKPGSMPRLR